MGRNRLRAPEAPRFSVESDAPWPSTMQGVVQMVDLPPKGLDFTDNSSAPAQIALGPRSLPIGVKQFMPIIIIIGGSDARL
jgi:hypothetical protein